MKTKAENPQSKTWGIKRQGNGRYVLIDTISGKVLDDCLGHGFKTYYKAYSFGYNKYQSKGKCDGRPNTDDFNTLI